MINADLEQILQKEIAMLKKEGLYPVRTKKEIYSEEHRLACKGVERLFKSIGIEVITPEVPKGRLIHT